jgi:hypothetical protein
MHIPTISGPGMQAAVYLQLFSEAKLSLTDCFASAAPITGQLYGRPDREPTPSPNPALNQETTGWFSPPWQSVLCQCIMTQNP